MLENPSNTETKNSTPLELKFKLLEAKELAEKAENHPTVVFMIEMAINETGKLRTEAGQQVTAT